MQPPAGGVTEGVLVGWCAQGVGFRSPGCSGSQRCVPALTCFCVRPPPRVLLRLSVNFHTMPGHHTADEQAEGSTLQTACQTLFETMGLRSGSRWQLAAILCPVARPLISWLANTFPDRRLVASKQVSSAASFGRKEVNAWECRGCCCLSGSPTGTVFHSVPVGPS